jgi:hypothetical protein|tara:strand:+ start:6621 stop:8873 length:2253 start_codon:yes stop_codon:yes gene_type:complete
MGRHPKQEPRKEYLENRQTTWLVSSPTDFAEVFPKGDKASKVVDLIPATKGTRLAKGTFRIVLHLPNKKYQDKESYLNNSKKMKALKRGGFSTSATADDSGIKDSRYTKYMKGGTMEASRIRWDSGSWPHAELILKTQGNKRVVFYLQAFGKRKDGSRNDKGASVYAFTSFPSPVNGNLVVCPVRVGTITAPSSNHPDQFRLSWTKPQTQCTMGLVEAGHAPESFLKPKDAQKLSDKKGTTTNSPIKAVKQAEDDGYWMNAEDFQAFYEATGYDMSKLLEIQDVQIMDSETEQQGIERQYYNPSAAMVGTDETLDGYRPIDSATVDLTSNQPTANYGAEGETATYVPSNDPDMVSSSSFDEPTNSHYSAEGCSCVPCPTCLMAEDYAAETVADVEASVEPANEPLAVAEGTSLSGYAPIDSLEEGAPIGHGVNQYFGSAEGTEQALLDESTTNIGIEEGTSLDGFDGVDSVVVEAPLGHGVTQWYAEGENGPQPPAPEGVTGQDGPSDTPTNQYMNAEWAGEGTPRGDFVFKKAKKFPLNTPNRRRLAVVYADDLADKRPDETPKWSRLKWPAVAKRVRSAVSSYGSEHHKGQGYNDEMDESLGMRHRGGHEQSFTDRRDEASAMDRKGRRGRKYDDVMAMDAETNRWHNKRNGQFTGKWSKHRNNGEFQTHNADTAGYLQDGSLSMDGYTPLESVDVDRTSYQPTQTYGADGVLGEENFYSSAKLGAGVTAGAFGMSAAIAVILMTLWK